MTTNPKRIENDAMAMQAMEMMDTNGITQLLVEKEGNFEGVIHIHNLIKEGII
jgi:arabinose-5-phosphate isomerase